MRSQLPCSLCVLFLMLPLAAFSDDVDNYSLFSNNTMVMRDRVKIQNGLLGSNSGIQMGYDAVLNGNVASRGNMLMWERALVNGNVTLGGALTLRPQARVTTVTQYASVPSVAIPTLAFTAGTTDVTVNGGETRLLPPGAYRNVQVSSNGNLHLAGGVYCFNQLALQADAAVFFNCSGNPDDPVDVRVLGALAIADRCRLILGRGSVNPSEVLIYSHQTTALVIGYDCRLEAVVTAPRANVVVSDRTKLAGKLRANSVTIGYDALINGAALVDADGDGMPDGWETVNGLNPNGNDASGDLDGDSLSNIQEFGYGTKPNRADTDADGLRDGVEHAYWLGRGSIGWDSDVDRDGLFNLIDPDSDNDGLPDGQELTGWTVTVQGTTKVVTPDPANADSDFDGVSDARERDGYAINFPNHAVNLVRRMDANDTDADGDCLGFNVEKMYGLNPGDECTLGNMNDNKYFEMVNHMGEWAVSPPTGHLNPHLASTAASILGATVGFGDDAATEMSMDRQMELCVFLPQDGRPITLKLDFVYEGSADPNDRFYGITYSGAVFPGGTSGAPAIDYAGAASNAVTWRITNPLYYAKGDYFFNFSYHYDKNSGEARRQIRIMAYYDDGTRVRIEYISPVKDGQFRSPLHFSLLVSGGDQSAYFRGETAVSSSSASYIDNVALTDYYGNAVRNIGKKAFNGYWFQYELGRLTAYAGGVSGLTALYRLEFDWVHDPATTSQHCIFAIDEIGNNWDDVQITYDRALQTQDYYCWYGGLARNTAVLRRGSSCRAVATSASLQYADAQVTVRNRSGVNVTSMFNIYKESGCTDYAAYDGAQATWRENWIIGAPVTAPAGMYTITMRNGTAWSGSTSFYLIFSQSELALSATGYDTWCYDEDSDGLALDTHTDAGLDERDWINLGDDSRYAAFLTPNAKMVTDIAVAASEGATTVFQTRDALRIFSSKLIQGDWIGEYEESVTGPVDEVLRKSGVTIAEALAGTVLDAHLLYSDCIGFAKISAAFSRSIGIPSRLVTARGVFKPNAAPDINGNYWPSADNWAVHVWTEAWIENPPTGTDKWYVFDATDFVWTVWGCSGSRKSYGARWLDFAGGLLPQVYIADPAVDVVADYTL